MLRKTDLNSLSGILSSSRSFLLTTHRDPDADGIGSMLALSRALQGAGKETLLLTEAPLSEPLNRLKGAGEILQDTDPRSGIDAFVLLDCAGFERVGRVVEYLQGRSPIVNIDHHVTNRLFGDYNMVDPESSSTGELIYRLIGHAGLPLDRCTAGNLFVAIQSDTGSFRYQNTTPAALKIAAFLMEKYGINPWDSARRILDEYTEARLKLLRLSLGTLEFHLQKRLALMTISLDMFREAAAQPTDSERLVDYPRLIEGVEIGVLIRQTGDQQYKFSLRSNFEADVALLAERFGGGGHSRAAGFDASGTLQEVKGAFLSAAAGLAGRHAS